MKSRNVADEFLLLLSDHEKKIYSSLIELMAGLGYRPRKLKTQGYVMSFRHPSHNKQIAKIGIRLSGEVFFHLRFSACKSYSKMFADIIEQSKDAHESMCKTCKLCKGEKHIYSYIDSDGQTVHNCGAYAYKIPNVMLEIALDEIGTLLSEQHQYFLKYYG